MSAWMYETADADLRYLFDLAREKTVAGRTALAAAISDLFFGGEHVLTDRERALMTGILQQLIHEVAIEVRCELAERLAERDDAPRELVVMLANDEIKVAHPILLNSTVLGDPDLIEVIHHRTMEHELAIAMRRTVSERVSDTLVETKSEDVIKTLLENEGAQISEAVMEYLVEESQRVDSFQNPIIRRRELSPRLAKRMYWWVSAALRKHIIDNFDFDPTELDEAMEGTVQDLVQKHRSASAKSTSTELAEKISGSMAITPANVLQVLRDGEIALFEALFTKLSDLRITLLRRILYEPGGEALAILCRWAGFSPQEFSELFLLTRRAGPSANGLDVKRITEIYDRIAPEAAAKAVKGWRRDPGYLKAIHELQQSTTQESGA